MAVQLNYLATLLQWSLIQHWSDMTDSYCNLFRDESVAWVQISTWRLSSQKVSNMKLACCDWATTGESGEKIPCLVTHIARRSPAPHPGSRDLRAAMLTNSNETDRGRGSSFHLVGYGLSFIQTSRIHQILSIFESLSTHIYSRGSSLPRDSRIILPSFYHTHSLSSASPT